jgi:hypothetical protein
MKTERFRRTKKFIGWFVPVKAVAAPFAQAQDSAARTELRLSGIFNEIERRKKSQRNPAIISEMKASRSAFLARWGVADNPEEIERVVKSLKLEAFLFTVVSILPVVGVIQDPSVGIYWVGSLMTTPTCLLISAARLWRAECISSGQFVLFKDWFFSR